jgi:nitroreductase
MNFLDLVKKRQSVRKYLNKMVEKEKIERCLEAARLAPSASNSQPWEFIIVDDPKLKEAVAKETFDRIISFNRFSLQAPVLILLISERSGFFRKIAEAIKDKPFSLIDIGIAAEHFCLQAAEEGLGTCILGWFKEKEVKKLLNIPLPKRVELIITLGYPESVEICPKERKAIDEIRSYNHYKGKYLGGRIE